ncbi:MAG: alpha/beta hydrolase [Myxococcaceae bacterium]
MSAFHPDLWLGRFIPNFSFGPRMASFIRGRTKRGPIPVLPDVRVEDVDVPANGASPPVSLRLYRPKSLDAPAPALLWAHGGGFIIGSPEQDETNNLAFVRELGITVAAVRYRLAPEHPSPAAVEDAYAALRWLHQHAERLNVDPKRIAIGGASAGGGLTATLALVAHDRKEVRPAFQLLVYPMLDDRTATRTDLDLRNVRVWTQGSNTFAWSVYLGHAPGAPSASEYAAAARRKDVSGLPPAWIGVGTLDLFHDEDLAYAKRLDDAGVRCELHVVTGAFHGFDAVFSKSNVAKAFWQEQARALRAALFS